MIFCREVQNLVLSFSFHHWKQHISKRNYEIAAVQENHISRLKHLQRWSLEFLFPFLEYYICLGGQFGRFFLGSCHSNRNKTDECSVYIFPRIKSQNIFGKHQRPLAKCLFSRNSSVWIFIFDTDRAQINSAAVFLQKKHANLRLNFTRVDIGQKSNSTYTSQRRPISLPLIYGLGQHLQSRVQLAHTAIQTASRLV